MAYSRRSERDQCVALLAEGVDRNYADPQNEARYQAVALLAEGVDRNGYMAMAGWKTEVALLAEGVDRNIGQNLTRIILEQSPSSRRAWIEICGLVFFDRGRKGRPPRGGRG